MLIGFDASRAFVHEATGTENYSLNLLKSLAKIDRENEYRVYLRGIKTTDYRLRSTAWPKNFEFKLIKPNRLWTQIGLAWETWRNPVDLLFIPAHTLPILRRPWTVDGRRLKTVVTIHDLGVEYLPRYQQFPQRYYLDLASKYAARGACALIAVSRATKADLIKRYKVDGKKVFVVHEGVDRRFFKHQSKVKVESVKKKYKISGPYILFVGTIQPRKNLEMLIEAFSKIAGPVSFFLPTGAHSVRKSDRNQVDQSELRASGVPSKTATRTGIQLIVAGKLGWDYQGILSAPRKFGVARQVKFIGRVPDRDLPALYSGADVFAFPSLFEGFGLPILEAISCGCPVIASDIAPHAEIMRKLKIAKAGILVKPNDVDKWVQVLHQTITKNNKRLILISKYQSRLDLFSWEEAAKSTLAVFSSLPAGRQG